MWVLGMRGGDEGLVERMELERPGFCEDWADDFEGLDEEKAWRGFVEGVGTVWEQIRELVEAE